jgi:hypothetical protein
MKLKNNNNIHKEEYDMLRKRKEEKGRKVQEDREKLLNLYNNEGRNILFS